MIFTPGILVRLVLVALGGVIFQLAFLSELEIFGTRPDLIPALVVCLAILGGSLAGATAGFGVGLLVDSALLQTLGASSLVLLGVGYLAGRYREIYDISSAVVPPLLAGALTLLHVAGFALIQFLLGVDAPVSLLILRDLIVKALLNVVLMVPLFVCVRALLRKALIEDRPRRRQARTLPIGIRPV